jgi:PAS domain S-box-containing protein
MGEGFAVAEVIFDPENRPIDCLILEVNHAFESHSGLRREQVVGKHVTKFLDTVEPAWLVRFGRVLRSGKPVRFEKYNVSLNRWFEVYAYSLQSKNRLGIIFSNISQRKLEQRQIEGEKARLQTIIDTIPAGLFIVEAGGRVSVTNEEAKRIWAGVIPLEKISDYAGYKGFWPDTGKQLKAEDWPAAQALLQGRTTRGIVVDIERFDGTRGTIVFSGAPIRDNAGAIIGAVVAMNDITDLKRMETELRDSRAELELQVQERTAELSRTVVTLHEEVVQRMEVEKDLRRHSDELRALASELTLAEQRERMRLAQVLHDGLQQILVGAKLRASIIGNRSDLRQEVVGLTEILDSAIETSRSLTAELSPPILHQGGLVPSLEWLAGWMHDKYGLTVNLAVREKIDPVSEEMTIFLFQATRELLFNVVKHANVKTANVGIVQSDDQIRLMIEDSGIGFDPNMPRHEGKGSGGFGLFSIRERIHLLGGRMEIDSASGQGSRFKLVLPIPPSQKADLPPEAGQEAVSATTIPLTTERKIRVLLVDDHMVVRQGLAGVINREQYLELAGEASDGESAIKLARELQPDVILMDISMPGMDGIEATRTICKELPGVCVIGLSMFEDCDKTAAIREAGAVAYLKKSGPIEAVVETIRKSVRVSSPPQGYQI